MWCLGRYDFIEHAVRVGSRRIPRYLGIDYGSKRIGVALSDVGGSIASPLTVLQQPGSLEAQARAVIALGAEHEVAVYVLGIPLNMDGTAGAQAKQTQSFGTLLNKLSGKEVAEWDERLSSRAADWHLAEAELTRKQRKALRDALAAQIILQGFLDAQDRQPPGDAAAC